MNKFEFSVLTRNGQKVDGIVIAGQDQQDAERKLRQMYYHCTVTDCTIKQRDMGSLGAMSFEDILSTITK
ncbi:MAG: hypothetical protein HY306_07340 [Nitrosomonadales bacterium]|nr:hypothetical protein [Nitrosomonadales bacterium]